RLVEAVVLFLRQRAVEVVVTLALAVPGSPKTLVPVDGLGGDDGRRRVVEVQVVFARKGLDGLGQGRRREGACRDDDDPVFRDGRDLFAVNPHARVAGQGVAHGPGKLL